MSAFTDLPPLQIPKKRKAEDIPLLRDEQERLADEAKEFRKKLRAHGSYNAEFWSAAAEVESKILEKTMISSIISLSEFQGDESQWIVSEEARSLLAQMRAQEHRINSFTAQTQALSLDKPRRSLREAFMQFFTLSPMGLRINTGAGKRDRTLQSNFRSQLIQDYESLDPQGKNAWCPVLHQYVAKKWVTASHIFSYRHGQGAMDAIFGQRRPCELFSSKNGLIMSSFIGEYFDAGVIAIVPDLPDRPSLTVLSQWVDREVRDYKICIIDGSWDNLDNPIITSDGLKWRDLNNRPLKFRGKQRPAARYLYFHYCLQVLRRAWKADPGQKAVFSLGDELGKPVWATPGRYIARNMLQAFVEELGHTEFKELMIGAACPRGNRGTLVNVFANQIVDKGEEAESSSSEEEEEDEESEEDL